MERATKFDDRLRQAIVNNGVRWGSTSYFIGTEIEKAQNKPELFVFAHAENGKEVAYVTDEGSENPANPEIKPWRPIEEAPQDGSIFVACSPIGAVYRCAWGLFRENWLNVETGETASPAFFVPAVPGAALQNLKLNDGGTSNAKRVCDRCGFEIELNEYAPYNDPEETKFPLCGYCEHMMNKDD